MNYFFKQITFQKQFHIDKILLLLIIFLLIYSFFIIWSASGQDIYIMKQRIIQVILGLVVMIGFAQISPRIYETWAHYLYFICILLLILVNIFGDVTNGAQRWLIIGYIRFQPSEIVKIIVPLMLARYTNRNKSLESFNKNIIALIIIFIPTLFVALQPDLGSAILIGCSGLLTLFFSGFSSKFIIIIILLVICLLPVFWTFFMHDYQRIRIKMLLNPESDPLGSGYHIIQSKIAIGSGGLTGKGWLHGTQSQLEFLPERHTDFIFSVIGEEFGFIGEILLLFIYSSIIIRGLLIAIHASNTFERVISSSLMIILFMYIFINIGMVSGILPVVGIPLPFISYGGSSLLVLMAGFGIVMSIHSHKKLFQ